MFSARRRVVRLRRRRDILLTGALAIAAAGVWSAWLEPRWLATRRQEIRLPQWPRVLDGFRVGVLADLHAGVLHVHERQVERVVRVLNAAGTDLILIPGDFVDADALFGGRLSPEAVAGLLGRLDTRFGVFGVLGNHDWKFDGERVRAACEEAGIRILENDVARIEINGTALWVAGVADAASRRPLIEPTLSKASDDDPILAVTHSPDLFPRLPERVSLTVAGHTHAGQVNIPFLRRLTIPSRFGDRYAEGHVEEQGRHLFVDRGVGTSKLPLRLFARPQVTVLNLRAVDLASPYGDVCGERAEDQHADAESHESEVTENGDASSAGG